jgi:hypothetical protein
LRGGTASWARIGQFLGEGWHFQRSCLLRGTILGGAPKDGPDALEGRHGAKRECCALPARRRTARRANRPESPGSQGSSEGDGGNLGMLRFGGLAAVERRDALPNRQLSARGRCRLGPARNCVQVSRHLDISPNGRGGGP